MRAPLTRNARTENVLFMMEHLTIPIQDELKKVDEILSAEACSGMETVDSIAKYVLKNGGRRIRPALFLLASRMAGAKGENLPRFAAAIELLHTANILHGDVTDDNATSGGQASAKAKWGNQASVLISDFFLCRAARIFAEHSDGRMMDAAAFAIGATTEGELLEVLNRDKIAIGSDAYIKMISGKTAALFAFAGRAAAIASGLEKNFEDALTMFGDAVGISFQLASDAPGQDGNRSIQALAKEYSEKAKANLSVFKSSIERDSLRALADYAAAKKTP